jgi:hypothetical protein
MLRTPTFATVATFGLMLAGCGGGAGLPSASSTASNASTPAGFTPASALAPERLRAAPSAEAIESLNAIGAPVKVLAEENATDQAPPANLGTGTCQHRTETFIPDRAGDPDSSEAEFFYDAACTHVVRDAVRSYTSTGTGSENVTLTVKSYLPGGTQASVRTTTVQLSGATFGTNGFPIAADGFVREARSQLTVGSNRRTVTSGSEIIIGSPANGANAFCTDAAAFGSGIPSLNEAFGWNGAIAQGSRTSNGNGSVTWAGTHAGSAFAGQPGSLSLAVGTPNSACPVAAPAYAIAGGTSVGSATSTISATFSQGIVENLTISAASLSGGYTATVNTNDKLWPANPDYITGVLAHQGASIASFAVNAFGDGTMTLSNRGLTFVVLDWSVVY